MSAVRAASLPVASAPQRKRRIRLRPSRIAVNVVLAAIAIFWLVPGIGLAIISLRPESAFEQSGWWTVLTAPAQLTFSNYQTLFAQGFKPGGVLDSLTTSLAITIPVTILVTVISSLSAYSLVFGRWRGRTLVFLLIVAMLVLPLQMALIPVASLYRAIDTATGIKVFGSVIGTIIFHVAFGLPFGIFLMRNFYTGIPRDLLEAGRIDGAGEWTLFRKVVLPLGLPAAASLAIFQFIWVWNDLLVSLIFLTGNTHQTLTLFLFGQTRFLASNYWIVATGGMISIVIPLIVFFAFQRFFVRGVLAGAVK
jgi:alpha-glucoside transport system permease protein